LADFITRHKIIILIICHCELAATTLAGCRCKEITAYATPSDFVTVSKMSIVTDVMNEIPAGSMIVKQV
jgi:hypothetical protein